jgi:transcriptional regulator NrdR family protein
MKKCQKCQGEKYETIKVRNTQYGYDIHGLVPCDMCNCKGYTTEEDAKEWMRKRDVFN